MAYHWHYNEEKLLALSEFLRNNWDYGDCDTKFNDKFYYPLIPATASSFKRALVYEMNNITVFDKVIETFGYPGV
mgnify:CR=1 FL=1